MQFLKRTKIGYKPGHMGKIENPRKKKCSSCRTYNRNNSFIDFCFNFKELRNLLGLSVHPSNYSYLIPSFMSLRLLILRKVATNELWFINFACPNFSTRE